MDNNKRPPTFLTIAHYIKYEVWTGHWELNEWEKEFVFSLCEAKSVTDKQFTKLKEIYKELLYKASYDDLQRFWSK